MNETPPELAPLPPAYRAPRQVEFWGRTFPGASRAERVIYASVALACAIVLGIAIWLEPDTRGIGTHEQLGLPPCGMAEVLRIPCPSCGFTTTFTLAAEGRPWDALRNQPFGFLVFLGTVLAVPLLGVGALKGVSWLDATVHWPWLRITGVAFLLWMGGWAYKCWLMAAS